MSGFKSEKDWYFDNFEKFSREELFERMKKKLTESFGEEIASHINIDELMDENNPDVDIKVETSPDGKTVTKTISYQSDDGTVSSSSSSYSFTGDFSEGFSENFNGDIPDSMAEAFEKISSMSSKPLEVGMGSSMGDMLDELEMFSQRFSTETGKYRTQNPVTGETIEIDYPVEAQPESIDIEMPNKTVHTTTSAERPSIIQESKPGLLDMFLNLFKSK